MLPMERNNSEIDDTGSAPPFPSCSTYFGLNSLLKETLFHWIFSIDVSLMLLQNTHDFPPQTRFLAGELGKLHQSESAKNGTSTTGRLFCRTFLLFYFINLECWVPGTILSYVPQHINIKQHKKLRVFNIRSCHLPLGHINTGYMWYKSQEKTNSATSALFLSCVHFRAWRLGFLLDRWQVGRWSGSWGVVRSHGPLAPSGKDEEPGSHEDINHCTRDVSKTTVTLS